MVWVKSEYADELAVLVTWLSMVVPWSVAYNSEGPLGSHIAFVRVSVFELQLRFPSNISFQGVPLDVARALDVVYGGFQIAGNFYGAFPPTAALFYDGTTLEFADALTLANAFWSLAGAIMLAAFVLSVAMYRDEAATSARLPVAYHRLAGWLLAAASICLAVATAWFYVARPRVGIPLPVGLVVILALAITLIRADTVGAAEDATEDAAEPN
jgi:uncharacterized membrane protein